MADSMTAAALQPGNATSRTMTVVTWALRLVAAAILLQTLFFKFTGAEESKYIFTKVHAEPWGRIGSGVMELIAALLILYPRTTWIGALLAAGAMSGAILSHLTLLGIEVQGDHGLLFGLALTVLASSLVLLFIHRKQILLIGVRL
jgi:putative oxidoreductase